MRSDEPHEAPFDKLRAVPSQVEGVARQHDQFGASLYRYALMILGRHDAAEDAVQQVFRTCIERGSAARNGE